MTVEIRDDQGITRVRPTPLEKAVFSVIVTIIIGLLGWSGMTQLDNSRQLAVLNTKLDFMQERVSNGYTTNDAAADQRNNMARLSELDRRITAIENRR